ncbi:hypothetical protein LEN26_017085 [Aphanomyces euteiches]|nr:hypothetical protein LEN26_017085 [Aphanomyces euteiches]KAH9114089.1 hypothetical protein AeMF1_011795 [Aphanomyces euteiches]KAH9191753.1 hypothetical protein AeNC1_006270 [Aphanomyces euteiches]
MNAVEENALLEFLMEGQSLDSTPIEIQIDLDGLLDVPEEDAADDVTENSATDETSSVDSEEKTLARPDMKRKMQLAKASKKHRTRQKDELNLLRNVVSKMESQLEMLKQVKAVEGEHGSQWEQLARSQYLERQRAYQENAKLKRALEDQIKFAQALETLVRKKPKLTSTTEFENEEWKLSKLGRSLEGRRHSMRLIMERQYEALNGVLVRSGLYDATTEIKQAKMSYDKHTGSMSFDMARAVKLPFPYRVYAEASWRFMFKVDLDNTPDSEALEVIDRNMRYISRKLCKSGVTHCPFFGKSRATITCSPLCQKIEESSRIVILWKSILEDELFPISPSQLVSNQNGWMVIEQDGEHSCHVKTYIERLAPVRAGELVGVEEMMKAMQLPTQCDKEASKSATFKQDPSADDLPPDVGVTSHYFMQSFIGSARCDEEQTIALAKQIMLQRV